jgi:hypothetical protein
MTIGLQEFRRLTGDESAPPSVKLLSVEKWGAKATATPAANTTGITNAIKWLRGGDDRALLFPDARYKLAGAVAIGETAADVISGLRFYGQSRGGTVLEQTSDGAPIWQLNGATIHSCLWEHFTFTHTNMQTVAAASVFSHVGSAGAAMHNCTLRDIAASNFYHFTYAPNAALWGNAFEDLYLGDFKGSVNKISGAAGKPNNRLERIYINAPSATLPLFDHQGVIAGYNNIEVANAGAGATMLADAGGGYHVIGHWALDAGYYANDATLFNVTNGTLLADFVYTEQLKVAVSKTLTLYACGGANSFIDVRYHAIKGLDAANAGTVIAVANAGPRKARFREIILPWSASVLLTDASTTAADFVSVDSWSNPANAAFNGDASVTLSHDSAAVQVFNTALTAARDVTLPDARALKGTQIFSGRPFRVVRSNAGGAFALTVKDKQGATVATIPASTAGTVDVVWQRGTGWIVAPSAGDTSALAPKNSPAFTGTPTTPDVAIADYSQKLISSKFFWDAFIAQAATTNPLANGTAAPGTSQAFARADHIHPTDTTLATKVSASGMLTKSVAGGVTVTLTAAESDNAIIKLTGAITANIAVTVPAAAGKWKVWNATTGAFSLTFKTPSGTGIVVAQGKTRDLIGDGTNVLDANTDFADMASSTAPLANGTAAVGTALTFARADHVHPGSAGGGTSTVKGAALNNFKKSNTTTLQAILARGAASLQRAARSRIVVIGDSYLAGNCAGNTSDMTNGRANGIATQLGAMLTARGIKAAANWTVGDALVAGGAGATAAQINAYDPRVTYTAGVTSLGGDTFHSLGGGMIQLNVGNTMTFIPGKDAAGADIKFDTVEMIVAASTANGGTFKVETFAVASGGTALTPAAANQNNNNVNNSKKITLTGLNATSIRVVITCLTGSIFMQALGVRLSTAAQNIEIINCSASGQQLKVLATAKGVAGANGDIDTWNNFVASDILMDTSALNCTIIDGWFNDNGVSTMAATQGYLDTMIKHYKALGDVIFLGYGNLMPAAMDPTVFSTWQSAMYSTCLANDIPYVDPPAAMPSAATMNTWGMYGDGGWHFTADGQALIARMMLEGFESVM